MAFRDILRTLTGGASAQDAAKPEPAAAEIERSTLVFEARITDGMGMYSELKFPTRSELFNNQATAAQVEWLDSIQPGSLNITVDRDGYPAQIEDLGKGYNVQKLDNGLFPPELVIAQSKIGNNSIRPYAGAPERGAAQVWPCTVEKLDTHETFNAFAVRRIGSAYSDVIELMADRKLRDAHGLKTGTPVRLTLHSGRNVRT